MAITDPKDDLQRYLQVARDAVVWKLDGLAEYDARRPLTPTGTNLLGLVKHLAWVEAGYLGATFGRPFPEPVPWFDDRRRPDLGHVGHGGGVARGHRDALPAGLGARRRYDRRAAAWTRRAGCRTGRRNMPRSTCTASWCT